MMHTYRLALIGFGNVGQGFAQILRDQGAQLAAGTGADLQIVAVSDLMKGSVYDPDGLAPAALLAAVQAQQSLESVAAPHKGWDALRTIAETLDQGPLVSEGWIESGAGHRLAREHESGREDHHVRLWMLLNLDVWCRIYLNLPGRAAWPDELETIPLDSDRG